MLLDGVKYSFQLLGDFSVSTENTTIHLRGILGNQLSSLFAYFLCNHTQSVSKEKIIDTFWQDSENPANALKFAIFRLRNTLKKIDEFKDIDWILTVNGGYQINNNISFSLDIDSFEQNILYAKQNNDISYLENAVNMYQGSFLDGIDADWIQVDKGYYNSVVTEASADIAESLLEQGKSTEAIAVLEKSLEYDELDEQLISLYIKALIQNKKYNQAMQYYQFINQKYLEILGFSLESSGKKFETILSEQGVSLYNRKNIKNISKIQNNAGVSGPMIVNPEIMKSLCLYEANNVDRSDTYAFALKISVKTDKEKLKSIKDDLLSILKVSFRKSDVLSEANEDSFELLLKFRNEEDTEIIEKRILSRFSKKYEQDNILELEWRKL